MILASCARIEEGWRQFPLGLTGRGHHHVNQEPGIADELRVADLRHSCERTSKADGWVCIRVVETVGIGSRVPCHEPIVYGPTCPEVVGEVRPIADGVGFA